MFKSELPCLPLIEERFHNEIRKRYPMSKWDINTPKNVMDAVKYPEFDFHMFSQVWESTALGFNGIGGQALTKAYTTVVKEMNLNIYGVFFEERFAYAIENPNEIFFEDFDNHNMKAVYEAFKYNNTDAKVYKLGEDKE